MTDVALTRLACRLWRLVAKHTPWLNIKTSPAPCVELNEDHDPELSWFNREQDSALCFFIETDGRVGMGHYHQKNAAHWYDPSDELIVERLRVFCPPLGDVDWPINDGEKPEDT